MTKLANIARYVSAIVLPVLLVKYPTAGILICFAVLWLNNYLDDILFYLSSLEVRNESFCISRVVSPVNGIVTKVERGVPAINLHKIDCLDKTSLAEFSIANHFEKKWKSYDHIAIYLNKFNKHIVLHPDNAVNMYRHYSDGNLEMVNADELVSDNIGEYMKNDALIVEYRDFFMVLTMDKYISEYALCKESNGVLCQIMRGSQCDLFFKSGTFMYPKVGDCLDVYDPVANVNVGRMSYNVEEEARQIVTEVIKQHGGFVKMALNALWKSLCTFKCLWLLCLVVILPALAYATPLHTLVSYVGFSSIYLFLFVRSYRHLMYSLMNVFGLKEWMVNSYKSIGKAHQLWKK